MIDNFYKKYVSSLKNEYVILKGSVPGSSKRPVELTEPIRANNSQLKLPQIKYISLESKQWKQKY